MTGAEEPLRADGAAHCVAHRLRYDPQLNVGCVLCQRAFTRAPEVDRSLRLFMPTSFGVLAGMLAAVALEFSPSLRPPEPERRVAWQGLGAPSARAEPAERQDWEPAPTDNRRAPLPVGAPKGGLAGAAVRGDLVALEQALAAGAAIDELDGQGVTPLLWALRGRRVDAVRTLIERGAQVDLRTPDGRTPLMLAAMTGLEAVSALLIERGAKLDLVDGDGETALMQAVMGDHPAVVSNLLARGADVGLADGRGRNALMHAGLSGVSAATVDALIDGGAATEARGRKEATALMYAASWGRTRTVRALIARGARLDARDDDGWSALDWVVNHHVNEKEEGLRAREETFDLLIASGIDPRLVINPATNPVDFRAKLEALYARHGLGPLATYPLGSTASRSKLAEGAALDSPATIKLLARANGGDEEDGKLAAGVLVGYRGWTSVPKLLARAVVREVGLYGAQRATLVGDARGEGEWSVADVLLLELTENGALIDIAFVGSASGVEVNGKPVRRLGTPATKHQPGEVDLTDWLVPSGRELVVSALSSYRGGSVSEVFLRINGAGASRVAARAEVDGSGAGGTL